MRTGFYRPKSGRVYYSTHIGINKGQKNMNEWLLTILRQTKWHTRQLLFLLLDRLIPSDPYIILFASDNGQRFSGNPKSLFEYFRQKPDFKCFWVTTSSELYEDLRTQYGSQVILARSFHGWMILAKAGWIFISHGLGDYGHYPIYYTSRIIQTWHGKPYKNDGLLKPTINTKSMRRLSKEVDTYYAMTASSTFCRYYLSAAFGINVYQILPFGYPRDELLLSPTASQNNIDNFPLDLPMSIQHIILYAPTYRDQGNVKWFPFPDSNYETLNQWLNEHQAILLLRAHVNDSQLREFGYSNIKLFSFEHCQDIYTVLPAVSVLISDYSSLYIDYLQLDRPCIFLDYDFEEFTSYRGTSLDREFIAVGDHPRTQEEFLASLETALVTPHKDSMSRQRVNKFFNNWSTLNTNNKFYKFILQSNNYPRSFPPLLIWYTLQD